MSSPSDPIPPPRPAGTVIPLGADSAMPEEPPPSPPGPLHGAAITGMALFALMGIGSVIAFVTVGWPGATGRYVIGMFVTSILGFMACASSAVFTAARDTYPRANAGDASDDPSGDEHHAMEIDGHPTQDIIDELIRRGAVPSEGGSSGPDIETLRFIAESHPDIPGRWLFLPQEVFLTGLDDVPPE